MQLVAKAALPVMTVAFIINAVLLPAGLNHLFVRYITNLLDLSIHKNEKKCIFLLTNALETFRNTTANSEH